MQASYALLLTSIDHIIRMKQTNRKQQFAEQFEESQANYSQVNNQQPTSSEGRPIQLLKIRPTGKIEINPQALQIIAGISQPIGFVSLVGKMRTGKSCLLNRLLHLSGAGFRVDPSTSSCTQGIWMWSEPYQNRELNSVIFFLDTQGTDSLVKDIENDTKIFTLAVLLSSYFIYNSVGSIDERSLSDLQMVTALSKQIKTGDDPSAADSQLYRYMPKFMWLLRDFMLKIEDQRGRRITPSQYLENCLTEQNTIGKINESSRKIKKSLMSYFTSRECLTLVRPVDDEKDLQLLNSLPDYSLRRQFLDGVNTLRSKILTNTTPKTYEGQVISGYAMASMIENYVEAFNSGKVPNIRSAWQQITEDEGASAYAQALNKYEEIFTREFSNQQPKGQEIYRILGNLKEQTLKQFEVQSYSNRNEDYLKKLKALILEKEQLILEENSRANELRNTELLQHHAQSLRTKIESNYYASSKNRPELKNDIQEVVKKYNKQARGDKKGEIIAQFINHLTPIVLNMEGDNTEQLEEKKRAQIKLSEYEKKMKSQQAELESLRKQNEAKEAALQLKTGSNKKPMPTKDKEREKSKGGCCGGEKCEIM